MRNNITPREKEVIVLVSKGLSNRDIAIKLCISVGTVKVHIKHILSKLYLENRTQLVSYYFTSFDNDLPVKNV